MVGACVARYLQRDGHDVVIIDPLGPGEGASYGNAGCFNPSSLVPIAGPDTFKQVPKYLMDPLGPLSIRWSYLPQLSPWLIRYGLAGTPEKIKQQALALKSLIAPCFDALLPLVEDAGARDLVKRDGILIVYRSRESVAADARGWALRRENGIVWEELDQEQLRAFDPNLTPDAKFGKHVPNNGHTVNPSGLVKAFVDNVLKAGGRLVKAEAKDNPIFKLFFPAVSKVRRAEARLQARQALRKAALAILIDGADAAKTQRDPFGDGPFEYIPFDGGFELRSKFKAQDKQASLTVGRRKEQEK